MEELGRSSSSALKKIVLFSPIGCLVGGSSSSAPKQSSMIRLGGLEGFKFERSAVLVT